MKILKSIYRAFKKLTKTLSNPFQRRQQRMVFARLETERLDSIRNPDKYRGK